VLTSLEEALDAEDNEELAILKDTLVADCL
jgi:hypothetical protein